MSLFILSRIHLFILSRRPFAYFVPFPFFCPLAFFLSQHRGEEALDNDDDEENDTFSSYVALDDVTVFEADELEAIALLTDTWEVNLDLEVSAQLVQANAQAYLSFGNEKGKGKGKAKSKGRYPVRPSHLLLEDRRRRLRTEAKTECRACGRKGHLAHDRECGMTPSSSSSQNQARTARITQQHLSNQAKQVAMCLFSMTSVMTLKHPRTWSVKTYLFQRSQPDRHL